MTFDGFDAAVLIEATPTLAIPLAADATEGPTLQDALAAKQDALLPDLWHSRAAGTGSSGLEGSGPLRPLKPDELLLIAGGNGSEFTVWGPDPWDYWDPSLPNDPDPDGGWGGGGGNPPDPPDDSQDCRDRNALSATEEIKAHPDDGSREHGSVVYRGADGAVHHSPPIHGTPDGISREAVLAWMTANGVSMTQVIGFVHNHDAWIYATSEQAALVNRYPSGNDWNFADWMVGAGAGGTQGGAGFAMYVIDTSGNLREFEYSTEAYFKSLSQSDKEGGDGLPGTMHDEGGSCG